MVILEFIKRVTFQGHPGLGAQMSTWPLTVSNGPSPSSGKKLCRTQLLPIPVMTPECFGATEAITSFAFIVSQMTCIVYIYGSCYNGTKSLIKQNHYGQEKTFKCTPKCKMQRRTTRSSRSLEQLTQPSPAQHLEANWAQHSCLLSNWNATFHSIWSMGNLL